MADTGDAPTKTCPDCAEQVRAEAAACHFCGHRFVPEADTVGSVPPVAQAGDGAPPTPPAPPAAAPTAPVTPAVPVEAPARKGPSIGVRILIAVAAVVVGVVGAIAFVALTRDEAPSVEEFRSRLASAGLACEEWEVRPDPSDQIDIAFCALGGGTAYLEIWTYADRPTQEEWVAERCGGAVPTAPQALVWGEQDWVIGVNSIDPSLTTSTAETVAAGLGGTAAPVVCPG